MYIRKGQNSKTRNDMLVYSEIQLKKIRINESQ